MVAWTRCETALRLSPMLHQRSPRIENYSQTHIQYSLFPPSLPSDCVGSWLVDFWSGPCVSNLSPVPQPHPSRPKKQHGIRHHPLLWQSALHLLLSSITVVLPEQRHVAWEQLLQSLGQPCLCRKVTTFTCRESHVLTPSLPPVDLVQLHRNSLPNSVEKKV